MQTNFDKWLDDVSMRQCSNKRGPRSARQRSVGRLSPHRFSPGQVDSLSAYRFPLPAPGGEPFAPPRGESAATGKAPQGRQCAWLGSGTPQSPCLDLWSPAKPRVNCTTSFAVRSGSAWAHSLRAHSLHGAAVLAGPIHIYVILVVSCVLRCIFSHEW